METSPIVRSNLLGQTLHGGLRRKLNLIFYGHVSRKGTQARPHLKNSGQCVG
jgi:hypothetical protein